MRFRTPKQSDKFVATKHHTMLLTSASPMQRIPAKSRFLPLLGIALIFMMAGCEKEPVAPPSLPDPAPDISYIDLKHRAITRGANGALLDLNNDKRPDIYFGVQLVGDPINKVDKNQWIIVSDSRTRLAVNTDDQVPALPNGFSIPVEDFDGYSWYESIESTLMERIDDVNGIIGWRGSWLGITKKYLPFQIGTATGLYNGWIELTVDAQQQQVTLHRAAVSTTAGKAIVAGK
jgi:hypothetical protein